ncbi:unnamed protein product [Acanthoscelides obtectus]|uniref:Uncharacterized protein n=1 Tax=Acanthoscelides obtectus TaxID=200917 RepID=A0A9P0KE15_ACAOB|nr:unnamed protein product [Acanthoscelides obtectus]CAK1666841.1 hypothetical protein AOBTE_LOCUS25515 [Acanthoscelides obtectus]
MNRLVTVACWWRIDGTNEPRIAERLDFSSPDTNNLSSDG